MAAPEKTTVCFTCKDGKGSLQVKHKTRGIVGEFDFSSGTGTGNYYFELSGTPTIIQASGVPDKPKSPAKVTRKAKAKPAAPPAEPVEEVKPKDDFQLSGEDGL